MSELKRSRRNDRWKANRNERKESLTGNIADGYVFTFGKHKGMSVTNVPVDYLMWMIGQEFHEAILNAVHKELIRRNKLKETVKNGTPADRKAIESVKPVPGSMATAETAETHYQWTGPTGIVEWILNGVDMSGRELELCPF